MGKPTYPRAKGEERERMYEEVRKSEVGGGKEKVRDGRWQLLLNGLRESNMTLRQEGGRRSALAPNVGSEGGVIATQCKGEKKPQGEGHAKLGGTIEARGSRRRPHAYGERGGLDEDYGEG